MIGKDDIKDILRSVKAEWPAVTDTDIAFAVLCDSYDDKALAYKAVYGSARANVDTFYESKGMSRLRKVLESYGVGGIKAEDITKEENKGELIKMISDVEDNMTAKRIDIKDGLKLIADIRFKLQDKFEMEESQKQRRLIQVPNKHDYICPHTHRECTKMPSKEACMKYYNLTSNGE